MNAATYRLKKDFDTWMGWVLIAVLLLGIGIYLKSQGFLSQRSDVTLKPCQTCPSCSCKPLLGGPRCGCPK